MKTEEQIKERFETVKMQLGESALKETGKRTAVLKTEARMLEWVLE